MNNISQNEQLADNILLTIRQPKSRKPHTVDWLSKRFQVPPSIILQALKQIESWGYKIKKNQANEVAFISAPDNLTATEIGYRLKTKYIAQKIYAYQSVKSTNDIAYRLAESKEKEGAIVTAEEQTKGKGRLGRKWFSPSQAGIYVSIIIKPKLKPEDAPGISIMTALALANSIGKFSLEKVKIKWPNDIIIDGKKVAGILTELSAEKNKVNFIIVGVGINVNQKKSDFPDEIKKTASSLRRINKRKVNRIELLKLFLVNFEKEYEKYIKSKLTPSRKKIRQYSSLLGNHIVLKRGKTILEGKAVDINEKGALIIEKDKKLITITSGEVSVVKENQ